MVQFTIRTLVAATALALAMPVLADDATTAKAAKPVHKATKAVAKKGATKKAPAAAEEPEEKTDDLTAGGSIEYVCELGSKLEIFSVASDSAVSPSLLAAATSAPCATSALIESRLALAAARCSGRQPAASAPLTSAPAPMSSPATSLWLPARAACSGVLPFGLRERADTSGSRARSISTIFA